MEGDLIGSGVHIAIAELTNWKRTRLFLQLRSLPSGLQSQDNGQCD